ncbi:MAG: nucleotide exchange factor GrpE [Patescibacteria group bacterium]
MDEPQISKEDEYLNSWKRAQADLDNFKKDEKKRAEEFVKFSNETLILEVLDVVANLELAARHIKDEGLKITIKQFESLLKKYGVERIAVAGQKFDPAIHEAVGELADDKDLVEERPGYTMHGKVIRPARVNTQ